MIQQPLALKMNSDILDGGFDNGFCSFGGNGIDAGLDLIAAPGKTFFHRDVSRGRLGKGSNEGVVVGACFADRFGNAVDGFAGQTHESKFVTYFNGRQAAFM